MGKKIILTLILLISFFTLNNVNAESVSNYVDLQSYDKVYKLSEDSNVSLPFVKVFKDKAIFDNSLNSSGLSFASKTLEISDKTAGVQTIISADTVEIKGTIEYGIILASNVIISGTVEKDVLIISESLFITETANIGGDIVVITGTMEMNGNIAGNLIVDASELEVKGKVQKDFRVCSEELDFNDANVLGTIYIETDSDIDISEKYPNATINKLSKDTITKEERKVDITNKVIKGITGTLVFILFNMLIVKICPNIFNNLLSKFCKHSSYGIIVGLVGLTTIPIVITLLIMLSIFGFSMIAIPILFVYIALIVVIVMLSKFIVGSTLYELLKNKFKLSSKIKERGVLALIYAALYLICNIPYIRWYASLAITLLSSGIVITGLTKKCD